MKTIYVSQGTHRKYFLRVPNGLKYMFIRQILFDILLFLNNYFICFFKEAKFNGKGSSFI